MTAACLTLLHEAGRPIWPWCSAESTGLLVEAYPAAQLHHWGLPHQGYGKPVQRAVRRRIVEYVAKDISIEKNRATLEEDPDALDAVLCAFAAIAVTNNCLAYHSELQARLKGMGGYLPNAEGWWSRPGHLLRLGLSALQSAPESANGALRLSQSASDALPNLLIGQCTPFARLFSLNPVLQDDAVESLRRLHLDHLLGGTNLEGRITLL
jgi:hypothetical protein